MKYALIIKEKPVFKEAFEIDTMVFNLPDDLEDKAGAIKRIANYFAEEVYGCEKEDYASGSDKLSIKWAYKETGNKQYVLEVKEL